MAPGVTELWDPGREVPPLGAWAWLVVLVVVVVVGVLGGCLDSRGDWLWLCVAVFGGLSSAEAFSGLGSSGWLTDPRALPGALAGALAGAWGPELEASTWVTVWTDSVEAPEDLSSRRSSVDACSSSWMGESSDSVKTSSETEPSVLRGAVLTLSLAPGSLRRCSASLCWEGCLSAGRGSRSLERHEDRKERTCHSINKRV